MLGDNERLCATVPHLRLDVKVGKISISSGIQTQDRSILASLIQSWDG